jgi:hypothetical protein
MQTMGIPSLCSLIGDIDVSEDEEEEEDEE